MGAAAELLYSARRPSLMRRAGWYDAATLADLGELTAQWLEGRNRCHPTYHAPGPDPETRPLVKVLARLNRGGFVTACSQPAYDGEGYDGRPARQRAAVDGFADEPTALRLTAAAKRAGLHAHAHPAAKRTHHRHDVVVTEWGGRPCTTFGQVLSRRDIADEWYGCSPRAVEVLGGAVQVCVVDLQWGRRDRLWRTLERAS